MTDSEELFPQLYDELRALALGFLAHERAGHTLQPTALVHEAYLRLAEADGRWRGKPHFLAAAAVTMRRVLVDHARRHGAAKRGGGAPRLQLEDGCLPAREVDVTILELDDLLKRLEALDARKCRVVELRFFAGMTNAQVAEALGVARSTVAEDWAVARAWLATRLGGATEAR